MIEVLLCIFGVGVAFLLIIIFAIRNSEIEEGNNTLRIGDGLVCTVCAAKNARDVICPYSGANSSLCDLCYELLEERTLNEPSILIDRCCRLLADSRDYSMPFGNLSLETIVLAIDIQMLASQSDEVKTIIKNYKHSIG